MPPLTSMTWPLMKWAVAVMGGLFGAVLGASVWRLFNLDPHFAWAGAATGMVGFGLLSFILFRGSVTMYMSLQGAAMLIFGILAMLDKYEQIAPKLTHTMAMNDLHRGSFTGMFGFLIVEGANNPGNFDQEHYLALRDWEPYFTNQSMDNDDLDPAGAQPEKPAVLDTRQPGMEVAADIFSINDKALGAGDPIRVNPGQRVMFHFLNASAIENRHLALPGHKFNVVALDGNPVPTPRAVDVLMLGPGERIDAWVEMNQPGVWILGAPEDPVREGGLGIVIEYANQHRTPQWTPAPKSNWDYTVFGHAPGFGKPPSQPAPSERLDMIFEKVPRGAGKFNSFTVNGKEYPHEQEFLLKQGTRYRLTFHNRTDDAHPLHLHRHQLEIAEIYGKATSGVIKDTVVVPTYGRASVDFTADQPGPTLFHCHIQQHMDFGFKALLRYS